MNLGTLLILPSLAAVKSANGLVVTRKFVEGLRSYADRWPGRIMAILDPTDQASNNLDNMEIHPGQLPFKIEAIRFGSPELYSRIDEVGDVSCVLGGPHYRLHGLPREMRKRGIISVMCSEYSLRTRLDVMRSETSNPLRMLRRAAWEAREELRTLVDIAGAHGIQCNGTPTFELYRHLNDAPHLYFDTRTTIDGFATEEHQRWRRERLLSRAPLHIAFSGRLLKMKGAHHLVPIARALQRRGINFRMTICGAGELTESIRRDIRHQKLQFQVSLAGALDFESQLLPLLREDIDLFVAPHVQGDPSCTYLETMACGVPIVGYANEAWAGVLNRAAVGWGSPVGKPEQLADLISGLDRLEIANHSESALRFARGHSFEQTFSRRIDHLVDLVREHRGLQSRDGALAS